MGVAAGGAEARNRLLAPVSFPSDRSVARDCSASWWACIRLGGTAFGPEKEIAQAGKPASTKGEELRSFS